MIEPAIKLNLDSMAAACFDICSTACPPSTAPLPPHEAHRAILKFKDSPWALKAALIASLSQKKLEGDALYRVLQTEYRPPPAVATFRTALPAMEDDDFDCEVLRTLVPLKSLDFEMMISVQSVGRAGVQVIVSLRLQCNSKPTCVMPTFRIIGCYDDRSQDRVMRRDWLWV